MTHYYWNDWYLGWGWILWFAIVFLFFSSFGNWNYTYRAHQKFKGRSENEAVNIINERYARGEINREKFIQMKTKICN